MAKGLGVDTRVENAFFGGEVSVSCWRATSEGEVVNPPNVDRACQGIVGGSRQWRLTLFHTLDRGFSVFVGVDFFDGSLMFLLSDPARMGNPIDDIGDGQVPAN